MEEKSWWFRKTFSAAQLTEADTAELTLESLEDFDKVVFA